MRKIEMAGSYLYSHWKRVLVMGFATVVTLLALSCSSQPVANFNLSSSSGQAPFDVSFTNSSKNADEFTWDFGDGSTATTGAAEKTASHQYTRSGTYTVTLTATKPGETPQRRPPSHQRLSCRRAPWQA